MTKLCLTIPGMQGKYIFTQESFYIQGILNNINEQDTSFLDCKHKHMMKRGSSLHKVRLLYRMVAYRIRWFHNQNLILRVIILWYGSL